LPQDLGALALYLKEADFISFHACYRFPASLRRLAAHTVASSSLARMASSLSQNVIPSVLPLWRSPRAMSPLNPSICLARGRTCSRAWRNPCRESPRRYSPSLARLPVYQGQPKGRPVSTGLPTGLSGYNTIHLQNLRNLRLSIRIIRITAVIGVMAVTVMRCVLAVLVFKQARFRHLVHAPLHGVAALVDATLFKKLRHVLRP
jgi:hypothetical protein